MLHEIFLSLSGLNTPLLSQVRDGDDHSDEDIQHRISPPERVILAEIARLSQLHAQIKEHAANVRSNNSSTICRAITSRVLDTHLASFRKRVTEVEASVLCKDAQYVGAYQIVPLSTIVAEFRPWVRRMEWLKNVTSIMARNGSRPSTDMNSGPFVLGYLDRETHTGFSDIQALAVDLLATAQVTWMRSVSSWILYGQLPPLGNDDFMVQRAVSDGSESLCRIERDFVPYFVTPTCASDILSIGNTLNQIRVQTEARGSVRSSDVAMQLMPSHLKRLTSLTCPLNPTLLEDVINQINASISENSLSRLLPLQKVLELYQMIHDYLLLGRGEFAMTMVNNTDEYFEKRGKSQSNSDPVRKLGRPESLSVKDSELDALLTKTWSDLATLQGELGSEDAAFILARKFLKFSSFNVPDSAALNEFISTLAPVTTVMRIDIPSDSPLGILSSHTDVTKYAQINAYLLSLRRAEIRLSGLWKLSGHRRCHPAPLGPPMSTTRYGRQALSRRRERENRRTLQTRQYWSSMSNALFFLNEFGAYLHGEVVRNSWSHFQDWVHPKLRSQVVPEHMPVSSAAASSKNGSIDTTSLNDSEKVQANTSAQRMHRDPRSIAKAHQACLLNLYSGLLVDRRSFGSTLKNLLNLIDHFVALFGRLQAAWEGLDLQEDDGIMDAYMNYGQDETKILAEMNRSRSELENVLRKLVQDLKDIEKEREVGDTAKGMLMTGITARDAHGDFVPWKARTLDRLIMKLDFLQQHEESQGEVAGLVEKFEDAME